ncbi:hypothetical protein P5673_009483 [Acropora cervicornis]|uniref:Uncharacterized protein n=1 Tax=Acropora cervicornis TaxID=6130 RepID=A0AAD9QSY4_ACRCE|nr:hypothetical protein P5673_009483 [Acropora cervicornis]
MVFSDTEFSLMCSTDNTGRKVGFHLWQYTGLQEVSLNHFQVESLDLRLLLQAVQMRTLCLQH